MEYNLTNRNYSKQYHLIVNAQYALLPNEIDLVLTMLTEIKKEDEDFKTYSFTKAELEKKTNRKWDSMQLKDTVKGLMSKPLEIKVKENIKGKELQYWQIFNWFSSFRYRDDGIITCRFDADLKPYLLGIKERFVISDLRMMLLMKSSYSKRIYLLLKEYSKIGHREFELETMHSLLKTPKSHKDRYNKFKQSVLDRSMKDINKFTDLKIEYQVFKRAKKIVRIKFIIRKNDTDLKTFIQIIREHYTNKVLFHTKDNKPIMCSTKGLLYYGEEETKIDKKKSQKLWEYLHENRENLLVFKVNLEERKKQFHLSSMRYFKEYVKEHFANQEIIRLKKSNREDVLILSIFPNGRLYDMSGKFLDDSSVVEIWKIIYDKAKKDELRIFKED